MKKRWEIKEEVRVLRKKGLSYKEIRAKMPVAKSTMSGWCRDILLSKKQISRLQKLKKIGSYRAGLIGAKVNQEKRSQEINLIKQIAKSQAAVLINDKLWISGLMLYWAEGHKSNTVGVSNSNPDIMKIMMEWFRIYCNVDNSRFKPYLHLHSGQNEDKMKTYWSKIINLPKKQFGKSYIKKEGTGHRKNILYNGTLRVDICNLNLLYKILGWVEGVVYLFEQDIFSIATKGAPIAQSVEQIPLKDKVSGSSPVGGTKIANSK